MVEHLLVPHTSWLFGVSTILGKGQDVRQNIPRRCVRGVYGELDGIL
jgi:hypothetical protein